jgi:hypothetical protein
VKADGRRRFADSSLVVLVVCVACACSTRRKETKKELIPPMAAGATSLPSGQAAPGPPPLAASDFVHATGRACRAKSLKGGATVRPSLDDPPRPLVQGDLLPEEARLDLAPDAELSLQATTSTREIAVRGPAALVACPGGEEEVRVSFGRISGYPGMGVRPGADVWIATPLGVVRFADAQIEIEVAGPSAERLSVKIGGGKATFMAAKGVRLQGSPDAGTLDEILIPGGGTFSADRPSTPLPKLLRDLVGACRTEAEAAREAGVRVLESGASGDPGQLGQRAFDHVRTRQRARAACEVARAAGGLKPGALDSPMLAQLAGADEKWKSSPTSPSLTPLPTRR